MHETFLKFSLNDFGVDFNTFFEVYTKHNNQLWDQYRKKEVYKNELTRLRFQKTLDDFGITAIDPLEMNDHYLQEMPHQTILVDGALDVLMSLKRRNYKLFVITNGFAEVQHKKMEGSGLAPYFEKVFISEEVKAPKPGKEIFEYALTSSNAKKTKSVMIGDDWNVDVKGALNNGIAAVYFNPALINQAEQEVVKGAGFELNEVEKLADLLNFL